MTIPRFPIMVVLAAGLLLFACQSSGSSNKKAAEIVKQVLQISQGTDAEIAVYVNRLPPGLPAGFPIYQRARIISSFRILDKDGENFFILATAQDEPDKVYAYYEEQLDKSPWQLQGATNSEDVTAVRFTKTDDPIIEGTVVINRGEEQDSRSQIVMRVQGSAPAKEETRKAFTLGQGKPLPKGYPQSVPIYPNGTVTSTAWLRRLGNIDFSVISLTKDPQNKVIEFYKAQLPGGGWIVTNTTDDGTEISLNFEDQRDSQLSGTITASVFDRDSSYTEISIRLRTKSSSRGQ